MKAPKLDANGACPLCSTSGGWLCQYHQVEGVRKFADQQAMLKGVAQSIHASRVAEVCARLELESDEFYTREQKAELILAGRLP